MAGDDLRGLLDPLTAIRAARPRWRTVPEQVTRPAPTPEIPEPEPIVTPERVEVYTDPADMPDEITTAGEVSLGTQLALLQAALAQVTDRRVRVANGRATLTSGTLLANAAVDLPVTFDVPALAVPESGWVQIQSAVAWLGRTKAVIVPDSFTLTRCTVRVTAVATVVPTVAQPITYDAVAIFNYLAPFDPEAM